MAKRKPDEPKKGAPEWQCTFSDLMNLLLCFFVLLFSMSSVDQNKWEEVIASMSSAFSIFNEGSISIGSGSLVGVGTKQLSNLDEYYSTAGQTSEEKGEDVKEKTDDFTGKASVEISLEEKLIAANAEETLQMYDEISQMTERYNIGEMIDIGIDDNSRYVEITISGAILFDSGSAELKKECLPLLSKVGDIIRVYSGHKVDIVGHTDNVPMHSAKYDSNEILSSARAISAARYLVDSKNIDINLLSWTGRGEYEPVASNATAEGRSKNRRVEVRIYNSLSSK